MKKEWIMPEVKELSLKDTEASYCAGSTPDGWYHQGEGVSEPHYHYSK